MVTTSSKVRSTVHLYALDAATGAVLWREQVGSHGLGTPVVVGGTVYVHSDNGENAGHVHALDAATGRNLWRVRVDRGPSTPSVAEGVVYVNYQGRFGVQALDAATGATLELYELSDEVLTPVVSDGVVYVGSSDWDLHALDAATGEIMWRYRISTSSS